MAKQESFTCDVCGVTKGEGNRWLMGFRANIAIYFREVENLCGYALADWRPDAESESAVHHFCSEKCAFTRLREYIRRDAPIGANVDITA